MNQKRILGIGVGIILVFGVVATVLKHPAGRKMRPASPFDRSFAANEATFVGRESCEECHPSPADLWHGSHHDLAMQIANDQTVLGDFSNAEFTHLGVTSTFLRRDGKYFVRTEGPEGKTQEFPVSYTFGADPLQQYLIDSPGGRLQVLKICWDARPETEGGQRWYPLLPEENAPPGDTFHWTGLNFNWNNMCAECHSTGLKKNFSTDELTFRTTWSEVDVSCEACHGPGSVHVQWAKDAERGEQDDIGSSRGLIQIREEDGGKWIIDGETGLAERSPPRSSRVEVEICARCHSRRHSVQDPYRHGPFLDFYRPAFLDRGLYYADGQILDEVYVYGSFLQSKMYREGVTCTDCHDPHGLGVRGVGNSRCAGCHLPEKFDSPSHHFHSSGSPGSGCVECHMPSRTYMGIDVRHDHSFRVPRPDLSVEIGTPNPCTDCHSDRTDRWAADRVKEWYGNEPSQEDHYGRALHAGNEGFPGAEIALCDLAQDRSQPGIARASALQLLGNYTDPRVLSTIQGALASPDPLVRLGALSGLRPAPAQTRVSLAYPLLRDPVRAVRIEGTRVLAGVPHSLLTTTQIEALQTAITDTIESELANAERAESHVNVASLHLQTGDYERAEKCYRTALRVDPTFAPAVINLSVLLRDTGREKDAERILRAFLGRNPNDPDGLHALGLFLARQKRLREAIGLLRRAARGKPEDPRYSYVFGVALHSIGDPEGGLAELEKALARHPRDWDILYALATMNRDRGNTDSALEYTERLFALTPDNPQIVTLLRQLKGERSGPAIKSVR